MNRTSRLLELCEDFLESLPESELEADASLSEDVDYLAELLTDAEEDSDVDSASVIDDVRRQLDVVWRQIEPQTKADNPKLAAHYEDLCDQLDFLLEGAASVGCRDDGYEPDFLDEDYPSDDAPFDEEDFYDDEEE